MKSKIGNVTTMMGLHNITIHICVFFPSFFKPLITKLARRIPGKIIINNVKMLRWVSFKLSTTSNLE